MQKHPSHSHSHNHRTPQAKNLLISIILNLGITIAQAVGGIVSGSLALLSDAYHNFYRCYFIGNKLYCPIYYLEKKHQLLKLLDIREQKLLLHL